MPADPFLTTPPKSPGAHPEPTSWSQYYPSSGILQVDLTLRPTLIPIASIEGEFWCAFFVDLSTNSLNTAPCNIATLDIRDTFGDFDITEAEWNSLYDAEKARDPERDWRDVPASAIDECDCAQLQQSDSNCSMTHNKTQ